MLLRSQPCCQLCTHAPKMGKQNSALLMGQHLTTFSQQCLADVTILPCPGPTAKDQHRQLAVAQTWMTHLLYGCLLLTCHHCTATLCMGSTWHRVYLKTCLPNDKEFMRSMESAAVATAAASVALSRSDADFIRSQLLPPQKHAASVTVRSTSVPS